MVQQIDNHTKTFDIDEEPVQESTVNQGKKRAFTHSSKWVGNVRYNPQNQTMRVMMNNKGYGFCGVPEKVFDSWEGSSSKGEYWWRNIKDRYNCGALKEATNNADDMDWPPVKTGGMDQVDCLMLNYSPDTGRPDGITPDELTLLTEPFPTDQPYTYPEINETNTACGNCRFYVDGGSCALVKGAIDPIKGICKFYEGGTPLPYNMQVFPIYEQVEAEYRVDSYEPYLQETKKKSIDNIIDREHDLLADGVPENEVHDILRKEFGDISIVETGKIPRDDQQNKNYVATGAKLNSEPSMHGEHGHQVTNPEVMDYQNENPDPDALVFDLPPYNEAKLLHRYIHVKHFRDAFCKTFAGKMFDLDSESFRPIPPSESYEYFNTGQGEYCKCYWMAVQSTKPDKLQFDNALPEPEEISDIPRPRDELTGRFIKESQMIRETIGELATQFNWMTPDYLQRVADMGRNVAGRFVLVRASAEAITDHRSEGEPHRRLLKGDELAQLTRTGIGKSTDINHLGKDFEVDSDVLDAEYDPVRKETQMMVHLRDPEIIHYIETGQINTVSINAGMPRHMHTECDVNECFVVPRGLVLGELDGIAFTWVVNDPNGIVWRGRRIAPATPGVKVTALELI